MPTVLNAVGFMVEMSAPCNDMLRDAGFEIRFPQNPEFFRGLGGEEETIRELQGVAAVLAGGEHYTAAALQALPQLRVIARCGVGFDKVDTPAATARGVAVTITPTANHEAVAEHALAMLLCIAKSLVVNDRNMRAGQWPRVQSKPVRRQVLGVFGLGRIGRSLAVRGKGVGMTVIATELYPDEQFVNEHQIELVDFDTLLARSDYLSIHCPLNDETHGMFNKDVFLKMKPGSVLLNTARGGLHVEADLIAALKSGPIAAAGLDVFEQEPTDPKNPLFELDNVVLCPHIAGNDELSMLDMGNEAAQCIVDLFQGRWPNGAVVNDELKDRWSW